MDKPFHPLGERDKSRQFFASRYVGLAKWISMPVLGQHEKT
jgi:hypothetical protein